MAAKEGHLESKAYLDFCRALPCFGCGAEPPSQAHHWPPKGRGVTDDSRVIPLCVICHKRAHGETVVCPRRGRLPPVGKNAQVQAVDAVLRRFVAECSPEDWQRFSDDVLDRKTRPGGQVPA